MPIINKNKVKVLEDKLGNEKNKLQLLESTLINEIKEALLLLSNIDSLYELKDFIQDLIKQMND